MGQYDCIRAIRAASNPKASPLISIVDGQTVSEKT
jgi:hypothetical protein